MALADQLEQLEAALETKQNEINNLTSHNQTLGGYQAEALNSRDKIAELEAKLATVEKELTVAKTAASAQLASDKSHAAVSAADAKKVEAAKKLSEGLKVLLG